MVLPKNRLGGKSVAKGNLDRRFDADVKADLVLAQARRQAGGVLSWEQAIAAVAALTLNGPKKDEWKFTA
ncbi:MAG: hypothetical protein HZB24_03365 [Desulfobacterales bacterium]|nr:hypothetical protein [Desulfobacterales bacterium]